jgi:DsbC/DsbD-like thiol-disulfide interchange protein
MLSIRTLPLAAALFGAALGGVAHAQTSAWSEDMKSAVRLISGETGVSPMQAGVEMKLASGWHTYWRYPGDSGIPPQFDFAGSDNLKSAVVLYPVPTLHKDDAGETIGYEKDVIFPVQVAPKDAAKPVKLHLRLDYAVCEKMCVPAKGEAELTLQPKKGVSDARIAEAFARVPQKETAAAAGLTVKRDGNAAVVSFPAPADAPVTVFAEGPTKEWALPIPKPVAETTGGTRSFRFKLEGQPPGTDVAKPVDLTFTILEGQRALEVTARLD